MVVSCVYIKFPAKAALVYPNQYVYIKPAPYWTSDPCDEFGTSQGVTILERDYNFFYVEYTRGGVKKRGYLSCDWITASGYSWPNHTEFNPGYNKSGASATTYYGPGTSYGVSGSIDADEGTNTTKPLLILGYSGSYAYVQYITNPTATSGHPKFKRAWVLTSKIGVLPPSAADGFTADNTYTLIKCNATGKYLTATADSSAAAGYAVSQQDPTGNENQQWKFVMQGNAATGVYYKIQNVATGLYLEVVGAIPVLDVKVELKALSSPNKAQEFELRKTANGYQIRTRCSGNFEVIQSYTGYLSQKRYASTNASQLFAMETMHQYWDKGYTYTEYDGSGKTNLSFRVLSGDIRPQLANVNLANIYDAADLWESLGANIQINLTTSNTDWDIGFSADEIIQSGDKVNILGMAFPMDNINSFYPYGEADLNGYWDRCQIIFNLDPDCYFVGLSDSDKDVVIIHELGHALKLQHPYGEGTGGHVVYSVMCQGLPDNGNKVSSVPSAYDIRTLKNKWGE